MGKIGKFIVVAALAGLTAFPACAETLTISGWYAAEAREVAMLRSLTVDRFDGNEGSSLALAVERALGNGLDRDGRPYFRLRSGYGQADGVVTGAMQVRVENTKFKRKVKRCADDDKKSKCKDAEKIEIEIRCTRRIVSASADVKITRAADDEVIYNRSLPQRNQVEYCEDDDLPPGVDELVIPFVRSIADQVAREVIPFGRTEKIRIRESRSGLSKADGNQMKSRIAATKSNEAAACAGWREMEARGVVHPTLGFNLGLCAESEGELDTALRYYTQLGSRGADVNEAISRVQRRMAGEADDADRNRQEGKS
jgi:hypothetical protein